jgi:hypothetical protein
MEVSTIVQSRMDLGVIAIPLGVAITLPHNVNELCREKFDGPAIHLRILGAMPCRRLVSRILFWTIIPLGDALLRRSSNLPAGFGFP